MKDSVFWARMHVSAFYVVLPMANLNYKCVFLARSLTTENVPFF